MFTTFMEVSQGPIAIALDCDVYSRSGSCSIVDYRILYLYFEYVMLRCDKYCHVISTCNHCRFAVATPYAKAR